jgi:putative component of toxin-antitoxin plasmid stabilization module
MIPKAAVDKAFSKRGIIGIFPEVGQGVNMRVSHDLSCKIYFVRTRPLTLVLLVVGVRGSIKAKVNQKVDFKIHAKWRRKAAATASNGISGIMGIEEP